MPKRKGFVPSENLIISFDTENDTEEVIEKIKPVKTKTRKHQSGGNKCKKIKLEINILFQKDDTTDDESSKCGDKEDYENYSDLSFLDDFNVDEIVESLNDCQSNIVKIDNSVNLKENRRPPNMDVDLSTLNDKNTMINNYECLSKGEKIIENNTTNDSSLTLCNEKSNIKTENKAIELVIKVESLTDHNTIAENNIDTSELKSKNMLETQREAGSVNGKADKISNAVEEVKTIENYASNINESMICAECCKDLSATNSKNMKRLSKSVTLPGYGKSKNDNILTYTEIKSEEVHNLTSTQFDTKNTNKLKKENTETDITANIDSGTLVEKLATDENGTLPSDVKYKSNTMSDNNHTSTVNSIKVETDKASIFVDNNKHQDEVILIEDSDNDCDNDMAKVQGTQALIENDIIDLTLQKDSSFDTKPKEVLTVDAVKLKTNETGSEPILILDTDYDELKANGDSKNKKGIMNSKDNYGPIDIKKKHLFCNSDNKIHASDKILRKSDTCTLFNHKPDSETKNNQYKGKELMTNQNKSDDVKIKNATVKNIPSLDDKKDATTNKGTVTHNTTPVYTKHCAEAGQDRSQTKTQTQKELNDDKTSAIVREEIPLTKETHDNKIKMQVDKSDTTTPNTVTQNQPKSNKQAHQDDKLNVDVNSAITDKQLSHINENDDINITTWLENKISQDMKEKAENTTDGQKDEKKSASTGNRTSTTNENRDGHIRMWVVNKGDTRTNTVVQNQPKTNPEDTKDGKSKSVDNMTDNITPNVNAKCQPNESNKTSAGAASIVIVNTPTPATEKQDSKTNLVKGDPRTTQNQPKTNLQDKKDVKSKTVNNLNSQNMNAKFQPKVPNKCSPQTKTNNFGSIQADKNLVEIDFYARRLECRMREYFGAKYSITDLIHRGRFSTIYRCKNGSGSIKAVKDSKEAWQIGAHKEGMMMKLQYGVPESNYNCVRYEHGFLVAGQWCYVMEYYPKSLQEAMNINNKSFHIDKVQEFSRQLVAAVTILRNNNIIHSDINPSHVLINDSETRIKLCGFDQAFLYNGGDMLPNVGTVNYRAPELILGYQADYGVDVWATALVMYEMATNRQLFPGFYNNDILYKQFCTLDNFPYDMLDRCYYRSQHFMGDTFVRIVGSRGEGKVLVRDFYKKERIHSVLFQVYHNEWAKFGTNRTEDKSKLNALWKLLKKMLTMDPNSRIAIEFVFADPFIYETF
ncbi:uncharacterized protein isoform X1 [Choristoneura fumiferana]|uniref:uncharacterized protein isoform X1 n=1 Tax=Choristoneura fumiferana TaxID=7141 RepID=UPI003D15BAA1